MCLDQRAEESCWAEKDIVVGEGHESIMQRKDSAGNKQVEIN
jgi:hypothetical protein